MGCTGSAPEKRPQIDDSEFEFVPRDHIVGNITDYWNILDEMGTGASCRVIKVEHTKNKDHNQFAMKEMKRDDQYNPTLFATEFEILNKLKHNNVLKYKESWIDSENFFIVNELCTGGELFARIRKERKYSEAKAADILRDLISAIGYCHSQDIVHRDLKPENIMYRVNGAGEDELVVIDFGDAKIVDDDEIYKDFVGTAFYLSPEIVRPRTGKEMKASDMWSIGVIAYVLVTGRPPYYGQNHKEILKKILKTELKFPKGSSLKPGCVDFIRKLCEKNTKKRMSAKKALTHVFLAGEASTEALGPEIIGHISSYHSACLLKRVLVKLAAQSLDETRMDNLLTAFNMIDANRDNVISVHELKDYLNNMLDLGEHKAHEMAMGITKEIGQKTDKSITFNGFREGAVSYDLSQSESIKETFGNISGGNKYVCIADLDRYFHRRVEERSLKQMLKEIDDDNDGRISFKEFKSAMQSPLPEAEEIAQQVENMHLQGGFSIAE